jgi:hypothetical protein
MSRNVFRRCVVYLEPEGRHLKTLLWNNVSWTAGGKQGLNFLWDTGLLFDMASANSRRAKGHDKNTLSTTGYGSHASKRFWVRHQQQYLSEETKWPNGITLIAFQLILTVVFAIQTVTFAQGGACVSKAARTLHFAVQYNWAILRHAAHGRLFCSQLRSYPRVTQAAHSRHLRVPNRTTSSGTAGVASFGSKTTHSQTQIFFPLSVHPAKVC